MQLPCDPDRHEDYTDAAPPLPLCATVTFALSVVANQPPVAPDLTELVLDRRSYTQEFTVAFQDEGELLTFQVAPADGQALPEWLNPRIPLPSDMLNEVYFSIAIDLAFDAMARPACVVVTATDQGGLSASVIFAAFLSDNPSRENPCSGVEPPSPPSGTGGGGGGGGGSSGGGGGGGRGAPTCTQDDVHGNSAAQATDIALATETTGAICPAADVDYFTVTAPGQGLLFVDTTGGVPTRGTIWQHERVLASGLTGREPAARLGARVQAGPVVVAVQGQGGATGPYAVEITFVRGYLENPGAASFQSGIGVLSGWVCEADAVEIALNGVPQMAAYGTERRDTEAVCGDTDNGFGLLFNWNLLGDGEHEVVAFVDGVELSRTTVTVTTLGTEFLRDVAGACAAEDFPMLGETVTVAWQQTQQNFVIARGPAPTGESRAGAIDVGFLENPGPNSFQSGIGVISGWVCAADEVEVAIGDTGRQLAAYGTERLDTLDACGDTDNGFGLLFNWNLLGDGEHEVVALCGRRRVRPGHGASDDAWE